MTFTFPSHTDLCATVVIKISLICQYTTYALASANASHNCT